MVINTNIQAQTGARLLGESSSRLSQSLARLSSGSKIVSPADDAAGLAVSTRFDAEISRTGAAINNLGNTLSFCQTQDGYLGKIGKALDRMSELAMLAQDITKTDSDRSLYNQEFQTLKSYVNSVTTKDFNGVSLFGGGALNVTIDSDGATLQMDGINGDYVPTGPYATLSTLFSAIAPEMTGTVCIMQDLGGGSAMGIGVESTYDLNSVMENFNDQFSSAASISYNSSTGELSLTIQAGKKFYFEDQDLNLLSSFIGINASDLDNSGGSTDKVLTTTLTVSGGSMDISTASGAVSALTTVKSAISQVAADRASVGATIARLNSTSESLGTLKENLAAANSRIKDVDVAEESTAFARYNILVQSGTAMLAQANSTPNSVLKLLS
ncbi:MAG: flagellin [Verrucomicrobia bacterium]|nr:flagellin [Verrucomicrobiota bacterium]